MKINTYFEDSIRLFLPLQTDQQMDCALDLMRRLPPQQIEKNLTDLIDLVPNMCDDLLSSVDQPLKIAQDQSNGKDYLLCDYNRDGDSYRSPWSNTYDPPLEDGSMPSERLRKLEIEANHAFDQYREMYFEGGVSSVYLWDMDHGFAGLWYYIMLVINLSWQIINNLLRLNKVIIFNLDWILIHSLYYVSWKYFMYFPFTIMICWKNIESICYVNNI